MNPFPGTSHRRRTAIGIRRRVQHHPVSAVGGHDTVGYAASGRVIDMDTMILMEGGLL